MSVIVTGIVNLDEPLSELPPLELSAPFPLPFGSAELLALAIALTAVILPFTVLADGISTVTRAAERGLRLLARVEVDRHHQR